MRAISLIFLNPENGKRNFSVLSFAGENVVLVVVSITVFRSAIGNTIMDIVALENVLRTPSFE